MNTETNKSAILLENLEMENNLLKEKIETLKSNEASSLLLLAKERDARYTLYFENVKLHLKLDALNGSHRIDSYYGDPVILKIALDKCREQLIIAQTKLKCMKENYSDTVPKSEYELLESQYFKLQDQFNVLKNEYISVSEKNRRFSEEVKILKSEFNGLKDRCYELERAGTPRPHWEICGDFIGGGYERWKQLIQGLSSRDKLMVILKELGPAAKTENLEYFDGLGTDPIIPLYLHYEGKIRNLRLSRRELSILINDIWLGKMESGVGMTMDEYVAKYFEERYQQASIRSEWAYNLCSGAEQMLDDHQIKLFWGVLSGQLSEDIYIEHRKQWCLLRDNVRSYLKNSDTITLDEFEKVARSTFPLKSEVDVINILEVVRKQIKLKSNIHFDAEKLFQEDEEGFDRSDLARELMRQRQNAQDKYIREIINELGGKKASNKMITVENLKHAFAVIDPCIDHIKMEKNIRWAFSDKVSDMSMIFPLPLKVLAAKLASGNIERAGPRGRGKLRIRKNL